MNGTNNHGPIKKVLQAGVNIQKKALDSIEVKAPVPRVFTKVSIESPKNNVLVNTALTKSPISLSKKTETPSRIIGNISIKTDSKRVSVTQDRQIPASLGQAQSVRQYSSNTTGTALIDDFENFKDRHLTERNKPATVRQNLTEMPKRQQHTTLQNTVKAVENQNLVRKVVKTIQVDPTN